MRDSLRRQNTPTDKIERAKAKAEDVLRGKLSVKDCYSILTSREAGQDARVLALAGLVTGLIPSAKELLVSKLGPKFGMRYNFRHTPINEDSYEKLGGGERIGVGYWTEVFALEPKEEGVSTMVLKIEFPKTPVPVNQLVELAKQYREYYNFLRTAYHTLPELIPESFYFIAESPRTGNPAVATLQFHAGDDLLDPLVPRNRDRVLRLMESEPSLKEEMGVFLRVAEGLPEERKPDVTLPGNLFVVESNGSHTLRFIDPHGYTLPNSDLVQREDKNLKYLRALVSASG